MFKIISYDCTKIHSYFLQCDILAIRIASTEKQVYFSDSKHRKVILFTFPAAPRKR